VLQLSTFWSYLGALLGSLWCGGWTPPSGVPRSRTQESIPTLKMGNHSTQQATETAAMRNRSCSAKRTCERQNQGQHGTHSSQNIRHPINRLLLLSATPNSSASSNHHNSNRNTDMLLAAVYKSPQRLWSDTDVTELLGFRNKLCWQVT
jgi:hypothetical protein